MSVATQEAILPAKSEATLAAKSLAEHILWLKKGQDTTPMGLIKLVYLCHAWALGFGHGRLVDESVITGRFGPIFESLENELAIFGSRPVEPPFFQVQDHTEELGKWAPMVSKVIDTYGKLEDSTLSFLTHQSGTPWTQVHTAEGEGAVISDEIIQGYFKKLIQEVNVGNG